MSFTTIFIVAGVVLLAIAILIANLAIRWTARLTIIGIMLVAILGAGSFWWWSNRLIAKPRPRQPAQSVKRGVAR